MNLRGLGAEAAAGYFLQKAYEPYLAFPQSSSPLVTQFKRSDGTARFRDSWAKHRLGRVFVYFRQPDRDSGSSCIYFFSNRLGLVCLLVGLFVRFFVLSAQDWLLFRIIVIFQYSDRDPRSFTYCIYVIIDGRTDKL